MNQPKSLWILDDTYEDLYISQMILKKLCPEFKIVAFQHPEIAFKQLLLYHEHNQPLPDAIILDLSMPVMNGFDFLESISLRISNPPSVFILTSSANSNDIVKAEKYEPVKRFFTKPLTKEMAGEIKLALSQMVSLVLLSF